ncbi:MAG TPA: hypothetical protein DCR97_04030 [Deltaproteobacteria bacterium]|nr:hypothetical protein [Deltaproteobacteria bacterium]
MVAGYPMKRVALLCTVLVILICCQPLALFLGLLTPCIAPDLDRNDTREQKGSFPPQGWGLRKTTVTTVRLLSGSQLRATAVVQDKPAPSESKVFVVFAAFGGQPTASGLAYLNNLSFRC